VPEDPIARSEIAALTRRYEQHAEQTNDALKVIKSDVLHLRLEVGTLSTRLSSMDTRLDSVETRLSSMDTRLDSVETRLSSMDTRLDSMERSVNGLRDEVRSGNARMVELLTNLVGNGPSTN
jgi:chromosome segregation ATPase